MRKVTSIEALARIEQDAMQGRLMMMELVTKELAELNQRLMIKQSRSKRKNLSHLNKHQFKSINQIPVLHLKYVH